MRAVIDTNVLISGLISRKSYPAEVVDLWIMGKFRPVICREIVNEYYEVITRDKFSVLGSKDERIELLSGLLSLPNVDIVSVQQKIDVIKEDSEDNKFLECALAGYCKYIVSGDQHLQNLKEYEGIRVLDPKEFVEVCR